ncbi:hypothetical protein VTO73DRAFT_710 [Trametes versicolor]
MSDDTKSVNHRYRRPKRVLVVSNASPESSSEEGIPPPAEPFKPYGYAPRPLPSPSGHFPSSESYYSPYHRDTVVPHPPPLTTDIRSYPPSNPSNGTLSSPSSSSSPAVESTPPPSTPGLTGPGSHLTDDGTVTQETVKPPSSDRSDNTPPASRPRPFERLRSHLPGGSFPIRRGSLSGSHPATSPTVSTPDSYTPSGTMFRSSPMDKVIVLVTTDAENMQVVDITGAMTPAFIRERIFTKLQISDEDQAKYSIYRTEIGQFAISEALLDEELFSLYKEFGDHRGSLKLLVSHSSATVHEPVYDPVATSTVNTIPPPVLPQQDLYAPLRPNRAGRIRQNSQSSASEAHPAEVGYEASVSDDLDHGDIDPPRDVREHVRPPISRTLPIPGHRPPSPAGRHRSRSPAGMLSPERSVRSPEAYPYRSDPYYAATGIHPGTSPKSSRFAEGSHPSSTEPYSSALAEPPVERERSHTNDGQPSSYSNRQWRAHKERDALSDRERKRAGQRGDARNASPRHQRNPEYDPLERSHRHDPWTMVPSDIPSSSYKNDKATANPDTRRFPLSPPSIPSALLPRPHGGSSNGTSESSRKTAKKVPAAWAVNWKHGVGASSKPEPRPPPHGLVKGAAKSMNNLKEAYRHPSSLQPGRSTRAPQPPLPLVTRPSTGGSMSGGPSFPSASSSGEASSAHTEQGLSPDILRAIPSPGYTRQQATSYTGSPSGVNTYLGLSSPSHDPFPRPHSALGDGGSSPYSQPRYMHSPQHSETSYGSTSQRHPSGPTHSYSTSGPAHPYSDRDEAFRTGTQVSRSYGESHMQMPPSAAEHPMRVANGPRTPPRSPIAGTVIAPGPSNLSEPGAVSPSTPGLAFAQRGAIDEDGSMNTLRGNERTWLKGIIDEDAAAECTMRPKQHMPPAVQLPTPPLTDMSTFPSNVSSVMQDCASEGGDSDDSSEDGGTIWAKKPVKALDAHPSQMPRSSTRPPLAPLSIESSPASGHNTLPSNNYGPNLPGLPPIPSQPPPPRTPRRTPAINRKDRISKFDNNFDVTWAPRPPPEVMYERLEEYFPEHDLDKPVIETPSGGASPTSTEAPAVPITQRFKHKKSIRVVAAEHKRQLDRTSRAEDATYAPMSRKRHTKMWGSKLEEVTTEQGKGPASSGSDASPGGGAKPIFRWVRGELIGKGTYGRVYLALNATTGEMIAVKQVEIPRTASDKDDSRQVTVVEALKLESETLKDLDHPNIVQYLGFEETPTFLSIFLEYVPGGSIASCLRKHGRFDEEVTKSFTGQILGGLEYLHSRGILHRDLKADNILVETTGVCKISDFGISKRTDDINMAGVHTSMQGTVFWMAPEVVNSKGKGYNSKIDIWSVGCVVFEMWTGQRPWLGREAMAVLLHLYHTKQAPPVPEGIELSALADDFRLKCFAADPDQRPSASELRRHPYLELQPGWSFVGFK